MEPLDLTKAPPRSPNASLGGLIFLPRTIDKLRAELPGGNPGAYKVAGFSVRLLDALGINVDDLRAEVAGATKDDEVLAWIRERSPSYNASELNAMLRERKVGDRLGDPEWEKKYPHAVSLPPETTLVDMLEIDDKVCFSQPP